MCQITAYLDGEEVMKNVLLVEPVPEGVRLATFFEQPLVLPALIRQVDLIKNKVFLESRTEGPESEGLYESRSNSSAEEPAADPETD